MMSPRRIAKERDEWVRSLSRAALAVIAERRRQIEVEGWASGHDDQHDNGAMAAAAAAYIVHDQPWEQQVTGGAALAIRWPWHTRWFKPKDRRSDLVRAGALIIAEIERLDRAAHPQISTAGQRPTENTQDGASLLNTPEAGPRPTEGVGKLVEAATELSDAARMVGYAMGEIKRPTRKHLNLWSSQLFPASMKLRDALAAAEAASPVEGATR